MLVLSRGQGESVQIGDSIKVTIVRIGNEVRLGFDAPKDVPIHRTEVYEAIQRESSGEPMHNGAGVDDCYDNPPVSDEHDGGPADPLRQRPLTKRERKRRREQMEGDDLERL